METELIVENLPSQKTEKETTALNVMKAVELAAPSLNHHWKAAESSCWYLLGGCESHQSQN